MKILPIISVLACFCGVQAMAQSIDFGDDASQWSNDGECDDKRFQGPGMTSTPLLDEDIMHDATDCRTAYEAGNLTLAKSGGVAAPAGASSGGVYYGDDSSDWANNNECDDRRFIGSTMTTILNNEDVGRDATDCKAGVNSGALKVWSLADSMAATQCAAIDFGNDSGEFANDDECDDARFEGLGMASSVGQDHIGTDASDCSRFCASGIVSLRNY